MIHLLLHTLSTASPLTGDCIIYWQNTPKQPPHTRARLIDATTETLESIWSLVQEYRAVTLVGIDLLVPLKTVTVHQIVTFIRALSRERSVTVVLNSDDALRSGDHEVLLTSLAHAADSVTALRDLPSGRDKEYAGMVRFTRGHECLFNVKGEREGERLYKYRENMMAATLDT